MKIPTPILAGLTAILIVSPRVIAQNDMKELLKRDSPNVEKVFLGQELNTRLDMIDFYEAGLETFVQDDLYGSKLRLDTLENRHARFATDTPVSFDMYLLTSGADSLVVQVVNSPVGNGDSRVTVLDAVSGDSIATIAPEYSDWLTAEARKNAVPATLLAAIPFVTAGATVDTVGNVVTLTNTAVTVPGLDPEIVEAFVPSLSFRWNGKKFVPVKKIR